MEKIKNFLKIKQTENVSNQQNKASEGTRGRSSTWKKGWNSLRRCWLCCDTSELDNGQSRPIEQKKILLDKIQKSANKLEHDMKDSEEKNEMELSQLLERHEKENIDLEEEYKIEDIAMVEEHSHEEREMTARHKKAQESMKQLYQENKDNYRNNHAADIPKFDLFDQNMYNISEDLSSYLRPFHEQVDDVEPLPGSDDAIRLFLKATFERQPEGPLGEERQDELDKIDKLNAQEDGPIFHTQEKIRKIKSEYKETEIENPNREKLQDIRKLEKECLQEERNIEDKYANIYKKIEIRYINKNINILLYLAKAQSSSCGDDLLKGYIDITVNYLEESR